MAPLVERLKQGLNQLIALDLPTPDASFMLYTDASKDGYGAVLFYQDNRHSDLVLRPVQLLSHSFNDTERNYSIHKLEMLAMLNAFVRFRYQLGRTFYSSY